MKDKYAIDLNAWLDPEQAVTNQLISKSMDENLYWVIVYSRWIKDDTWPIVERQFFSGMPFPMNKLIAKVARSSVRKQLNGHGIGKHSDQEIEAIAK